MPLPQATTSKEHNIGQLNQMYQESDQVDSDTFAEMRSNILLTSGEHYAKKNSKMWERIRDVKGITDEQKLRITKNHIQKITKTYVNNITSYAPGVAILPKNANERQDIKSAELNSAVWQDWREQIDYDERVGDWADDFVGIGEVATKVFFDPYAGPIKHYKAQVGPDGQDMREPSTMDDQGNEVPGNLIPGDPVFRGALMCEDIYGFNLLRPKGCKNIQKAEWLGIRKMVDMHEAMAWVKHEPDKLKMIQADQDKTYIIFDAANGGYGNSVNQVLIKEYYFRPCHKYPRGYYYITTEHGILFKGELPFGVFPIIVGQFDKVQTTPRGRSIIKTLRPYQVEINRAASKMAEHQITLGDDKILIQKGTTLAQGGVLPGIRGVTYAGKEPTVLNGRDGSQYLNYAKSTIEEMYFVAMVQEDTETKGQMDPMSMLFMSASQKKKFTRYTKRFERFLMRVCKTFLELAKNYYSDDMLVPAISKRELINIEEFRNTDELCYQIKLEAQTDDLESKFGKLFGINHTLQYVGSKLDKEDIGKLLRALPYANDEESFSDFTLDYDSANNIILTLDRGQVPKFNKRAKHEYVLQRLGKRVQEPDFDYLDPKIQANYDQVIAQHEQVMAEQAEQLRAAQAGFIPTDGYMVTVDLYVSDPKDPNKTKRARIPYSSVLWLIKQIERQGLSQDALEGIDGASKASIAEQLTRENQGVGSNGILPATVGSAEMDRGVDNAPDYRHGSVTQPVFAS